MTTPAERLVYGVATMRTILSILMLTAGSLSSRAGAMTQEDIEQSQYQMKRLVILQSTKDIDAARATAAAAAETLSLPLQLNDVEPHPTLGLSHSAQVCEANGYSWPCYMPRGRHDDGAYISIEHSGAFETFAEGYFIVVAASAAGRDPVIRRTLRAAKGQWLTAYSKQTSEYVGCMR